jgi:hypothetical protein
MKTTLFGAIGVSRQPTETTPMIERSIGIVPGLPWAGPLPGGGYEGKTKRLDRAIMRFAKWLRRRIPGPVQVRFNFDRLSGGAFVYPGLATDAGIAFDTPEIGLGARLIIPPAVRRRRDRTWKKGEGERLPALEWEDCWTEETPLRYNVLIYPQFLRCTDNMGEYKPGARFGYWSVSTPQEAYRLLKRLVNLTIAR